MLVKRSQLAPAQLKFDKKERQKFIEIKKYIDNQEALQNKGQGIGAEAFAQGLNGKVQAFVTELKIDKVGKLQALDQALDQSGLGSLGSKKDYGAMKEERAEKVKSISDLVNTFKKQAIQVVMAPDRLDPALTDRLNGLTTNLNLLPETPRVVEGDPLLNRSGPPYTPSQTNSGPQAQESAQKIKSDVVRGLDKIQLEGEGLDNLKFQVAMAVAAIASEMKKPTEVMEGLKREIEVTRESKEVKEEKGIKALDNLEKKLDEFKGRIDKLEPPKAEGPAIESSKPKINSQKINK